VATTSHDNNIQFNTIIDTIYTMRKTETDRKRLVRSHYSKIYGSNAVGRRRFRTGRKEPKADCDCESVSPQD